MPDTRSPTIRWLGLAAGVTLAALAACQGTTDPSPTRRAALTELPRQLTAAEETVRTAANGYSFALWHQIATAQRDSNIFVSPLSASFALGMTLNGAAGTTFDQMRSALQFGDAPLATINSGYTSLIELLTSLDPGTTMEIANAVFSRKGIPFNEQFMNDVRSAFDAEVAEQDFTDVAGTLNAVNGWANEKTHGRIPVVLRDYDPMSVMFLINAIYFKGTWRDRFDPARTQDALFHAATGGDQQARLMSREGTMPYAETEDYQAVDLAYGDSAFMMTVLLPKSGHDVESVAESLTPDSWNALTGSFHPMDVSLYLPKVTLSWDRELIDDMQALGMRDAFDKRLANFSHMSSLPLYMSLLKQKTFVTIDEEGTEAAAVTVGGISAGSLPVTVLMRVDHPFLLVIRERLSGTILFMGKIVRMPAA